MSAHVGVQITYLPGRARLKRPPKMKRWSRAAAAAALVVLALGPGAAVAAPTPPLPSAVITLQAVAPVNVQGLTNVSVSTNGSVNVTLFSFVNTQIFFNASVLNTYWNARIEPSRANLTGSGTIPFVVTVDVPGAASADSSAQILVEANVSVSGVGRTVSNQTALPIKQYFGVELNGASTGSPATFDAHAGTTTPFSFTLRNTGNGRDSYEVRVVNLADLQSRGIGADLPSPISRVGSGVTVVVSGSVSLPPSAQNETFPLVLEATSTGAASASQTTSADASKTINALPPLPTTTSGGNNGGENATTNGTAGSLPGLPAEGVVLAVGAAAAAAAWRRPRPPSQGATYRASLAQGQGRAP